MDFFGADWFNFIFPALKLFLAGINPYTYPAFQHEISQPPWTFLFLAPLAYVPPTASIIGISLVSLTGLVAFFAKNRKKWLALPAAVSFPFLLLLLLGNLDGLLLWGLVLGGPLGLILLLVKPQAGILIGAIWALKAWKQGKWKSVAILIGPAALVTILSAFLYPQWIENMIWYSSRTNYESINAFPWLVPLGIGLFINALRQEREDLAAVATILIAPYVRIQSWTIPLCLLAVSYPLEGSILAVSSWFLFLKKVWS